jgi:hypothetical protein
MQGPVVNQRARRAVPNGYLTMQRSSQNKASVSYWRSSWLKVTVAEIVPRQSIAADAKMALRRSRPRRANLRSW